MIRYVAFLRGINVGGHVVKMDCLCSVFESLGLARVKTFIASGNVLFESASSNTRALEQKIAKALHKELGFEVAVFIRSSTEVRAIAQRQPFTPAELEHGSLFIGMLPAPLDARDKEAIATLATPVDALRVYKSEVYWRAAKNFSGAIFSPARMEKKLGKRATFRNATTMRKLAALLEPAPKD